MPKSILNDKKKIFELIFALFLILIGVVLRFLPHPPNFAPISAIALFGGVYLGRKTAFLLPLAAMVISDIFIGYYETALMISVYGSFLICVVLGFWLKKHKKWYTVLGGSVFGAVLFFIITNFAVWAFTPWYAKTVAGLIQCYLMALPFLRNSLLGDLFYVSVFFGAYEIIEIWLKRKFRITEKTYRPSFNNIKNG